jgi:tRNA threonylcarbamoyladenosine biosynthesis protein TsaB
MLLLATDTSGNNGSIALADCDPDGSCNVLEVLPLEGGTFSAQLIPQIAILLARHHSSKSDIGAFAVVAGPGSFTGLRVGLAGIKALAEVTGKPVAAVSLLHALVISFPGHVTAALDAGRRQLYTADYLNGEPVSAEQVVLQETFMPAGKVITSDRNVAEFLRAQGAIVDEIPRPRSDVIACMGWKQILSGKTVTAEALDANYIRRTDAEILINP